MTIKTSLHLSFSWKTIQYARISLQFFYFSFIVTSSAFIRSSKSVTDFNFTADRKRFASSRVFTTSSIGFSASQRDIRYILFRRDETHWMPRSFVDTSSFSTMFTSSIILSWRAARAVLTAPPQPAFRDWKAQYSTCDERDQADGKVRKELL